MPKLYSKNFYYVLLPIVIEVHFMDIWCNASKELYPQKLQRQSEINFHTKTPPDNDKDEILRKMFETFNVP